LTVIIEKDPAQGLRLFRSLAAINAQRLLTQTHAQVRDGVVGRGAESPMPGELASAVLRFKQCAAAVEVDLRRSEPDAVLRRELAESFDSLVLLTGLLFPAVSGAMPAPDGPALQALGLTAGVAPLFAFNPLCRAHVSQTKRLCRRFPHD
jgi:hypothetical protein